MGRKIETGQAPLRVGDLFCGAGGFSEGFQQVGFRVEWALDLWPTAIETFRSNHPGVDGAAVAADILDLDPTDFEPVDVLIGSPPCVHFSLANRGGNGDRAAGLRLVRKFLSFVWHLRPKYWVMENVPNLLPTLEAKLQRDGSFRFGAKSISIPERRVLDSADFGVPQHRKRLFSGSFPVPIRTHGDGRLPYVPISRILDALPDPGVAPNDLNEPVRDPNYPSLSVRGRDLRDHFEDRRWWLTRYERRRSRQQKQLHAVYGRMPYPDPIDRPSRTITATRTGGARSTIVIRHGARSVRTLTAREAATVQGYPLTYQFWAGSMSDKDRLIGNSVPPPMARAIATAILAAERRQVPRWVTLVPPGALPQPLRVSVRRNHRFPPRRPYNGVVPIDARRDHRVELDNKVTGPHPSGDTSDSVEWNASLYLGYAKRYVCYRVSWRVARRLIATVLAEGPIGFEAHRVASLFRPLFHFGLDGQTNAQTLQNRWSGRLRVGVSPDDVCKSAAAAVERAFPEKQWTGRSVQTELTQSVLQSARYSWGSESGGQQPLPVGVRVLAATAALSLLCDCLNHGTAEQERLARAIQAGESGVVRYFRVSPGLAEDVHDRPAVLWSPSTQVAGS